MTNGEYIDNDLFRPIGLHGNQLSNTFIGSKSTVSLDGTYKKRFKSLKGHSEAVNRRRTDNTLTKRKGIKEQTTLYQA